MHYRLTQFCGFSAAMLLLGACQMSADPATNSAPTPPTQSAAAETAKAPVSEESKITKILDAGNIGRRIDIFERVAGTPSDATADTSNYLVDGCQVMVTSENKAVSWIEIGITPGCKADFGPIFGASKQVLASKGLTYADFEKSLGQARYMAPCMGMGCGNAFEPYFEAVAGGSHADNYIEFIATSLMSEGAEKQVDTWQARLEQIAGQDYIMDGKWNCERTHDSLAREALATAPIERIGFGRRADPYEENCKQLP